MGVLDRWRPVAVVLFVVAALTGQYGASDPRRSYILASVATLALLALLAAVAVRWAWQRRRR